MTTVTLNQEPALQHLEQATGWPMSLRHVEDSGEWTLTVHAEGVTEAQVLAAVEAARAAAEKAEADRLRTRARAQAERKVQAQLARERAAQIVRDDATPFEEVVELAPLFDDWEPGLDVAVGDLLYFDGTVVEVIQAHTTQADWEPPTVPALFKVWRDPDVAEPWVQPAGAHDAYELGARVTHNGQTWESSIADNVWEPGVHGWTVVEGG